MTLEEILATVAEEVGATAEAVSGGGTEFSRAKSTLAFAHGSVAEFRLDPEIADAALRTPSTEPSSRGPGWVRLTAQADEAHDLDRARAWFLSAWRNATAGS